MVRPIYTETACKSALNHVSGMPFRWSLNPYRGCVHGCHYCYARATHSYLGLDADDDFATRIVVKTNMPEVLRRELAKPSWSRDLVAIGTATDAYQPAEGRYRLTRRCLEVFRDAHTPISIVTKSTLILRDLDLLSALARDGGVTVYFTITTLDRALWRLIEPGTPPPDKRLNVMQALSEAGVRTGVFLAPILPGITDTVASLDAVATAARAHGAAAFGSGVLRLAPLVREHYLAFVAESFPDLLPRYERAFAGVTISSGYQEMMERHLTEIRARHGFSRDVMRSRRRDPNPAGRTGESSLASSRQLALPL